jgi:hypothetical protein
MMKSPLLLILLLTACYYPCAPSNGLQLELVGFTPKEADTIILKKFEKGKGFSKLIDSLIIDSTVTRFNLLHDTLRIGSTMSSTNLMSMYDYSIQIPASNSEFVLTEMFEPQQEGRKSPRKIICVNSIQSAKLNGQAATIQFDRIYLKK